MFYYPLEFLILTFYGVGTVGICILKVIKPLKFMLQYGKTSKKRISKNWFDYNILNYSVPKSNFAHFYFVLCFYCTFNLCLVNKIPGTDGINIFLQNLFDDAPIVHDLKDSNKMYIHRVLGSWLISFQAFRRSFECIFVSKFNAGAKMNILHYLMGLGFYTTLALNSILSTSLLGFSDERSIKFTNIGALDVASTTLFFLASIDQFQNHRYLASLEKYTLPEKGLFRFVTSAHYFDEVLIYFAIAILFMADSSMGIGELNFLLMWIFVCTNLSVSSLETFEYYKKRFPFIKNRFSIFPFLL